MCSQEMKNYKNNEKKINFTNYIQSNILYIGPNIKTFPKVAEIDGYDLQNIPRNVLKAEIKGYDGSFIKKL